MARRRAAFSSSAADLLAFQVAQGQFVVALDDQLDHLLALRGASSAMSAGMSVVSMVVPRSSV